MTDQIRFPNFTASATLTKYAAVKRTADTTVAPIAAVTDDPIGVAQEANTTSDAAAPVVFVGSTLVKAGAAVNKGTKLTIDANGAFIEAVAGNQVYGIALEDIASGASGTAYVDFTGGTFGNGGGGSIKILAFPIALAKIANGDLLTNYTIGCAGRIVGFEAVVTDPATTAAKLSTLNLEIGTTNVTGGSLALTSANMTPLGAVVAASAITAANTFSATDTISIEAASTTAFVEGSIVLYIRYI